MSESLRILAAKAGVATHFDDAGLSRKSYVVDNEVIRFVLNDLGYQASTEEEIAAGIKKIEDKRWAKVLDDIYICRQDKVFFDVVLAKDAGFDGATLFDAENKKIAIETTPAGMVETRTIGGLEYTNQSFVINTQLEAGYYVLAVKSGAKVYRSTLAVAPTLAYTPPVLENKIWGYAVQLYSVKSKRNWGVGDFSDLEVLVDMAARAGASIIGLNPLNTLSHDYPENASPYQSVSRLFLNPIYIDVDKVPEFTASDKKAVAQEIAEIKQEEFINYDKIYRLKTRCLNECYTRFIKKPSGARYKAFLAFCEAEGRELDNLAAFQAIYEEKTETIWGGWRAWPEGLRCSTSSDVAEYVLQNQERVNFFKFMQFEAARQFELAQKRVQEKGLGVGFYRDLAVGVGKDSAEFWSNQQVFVPHVGAGAPPDAFFPCGQKWGLACFAPEKLKECRYEPFIRVLRANMQNAGAIRVDHVMSLMRLFVLPDEGDAGTYIYYDFNNMLNLLALESHLNKCMVVGESIGNVPDGFVEALNAHRIYSLSVLWAERSGGGWGGFYAPEHYPYQAVTSVGTHDMPPLKMWWFGYDIELSASLGLMCEQDKINAYHKREADRKQLLDSIDSANVWPQDKPRQGNYLYGENYPEGLEEAVHAYMAKSASKVFLLQLEDVFQVACQQNFPGTDIDTYPNWRRRLPVDLEDMPSNEQYIRNIKAIKKER